MYISILININIKLYIFMYIYIYMYVCIYIETKCPIPYTPHLHPSTPHLLTCLPRGGGVFQSFKPKKRPSVHHSGAALACRRTLISSPRSTA